MFLEYMNHNINDFIIYLLYKYKIINKYIMPYKYSNEFKQIIVDNLKY